MTDHDDTAGQRDVASHPDQDGAKRMDQDPRDRLRTRVKRRKALDGSQLGEPVLDWSGITLSARVCITAAAAASLSLR